VDSCFQLLSLFFMTIGRNNEAPAAYALTSTIKRLLDHLTEADLFSEKDIASMGHTLDRLTENMRKHPTDKYLETLLSKRIERCQESLENLKKRLQDYAEPILATHEKLVSILRQMAAINTKSKVRMIGFA
jgi:DNA repair ATPase RecN